MSEDAEVIGDMRNEHLTSNDLQKNTPQLSVFLLGTFRLEWHVPFLTDEDAWKSRTAARALFKLLLCAPNRQVTRSQLIGILWPDVDEHKARESLRSAIKVLRQVLHIADGTRLLETADEDVLKLKGQEDIWVDADAFELLVQQAKSASDLSSALTLWTQAKILLQGEFLAGEQTSEWFMSRWVKLRRQELRAARRLMIRSLADLYVQMGQDAQAEEVLHAHVIRFPTDQDALYRLMKLLIKAECFDDAQTYYEQCKAALASFGKQPANHLKALNQWISSSKSVVRPEAEQQQYRQIHTNVRDAIESSVPSLLRTNTQDGLLGDRVEQQRRRFLQQTLGMLGTTTILSHSPFNVESWERLSRALHTSSSIDGSTLDHLEAIVGSYWQLFHKSASSDLLHGTLGLLQTLTSLLEHAYPTNLEQRLCAIAGKTSLLAGRIALDQRTYIAVDGYYNVSLQAAQQANDAVLQAVVLARMASSLIERKQPESAISFFQEAQHLCLPDVSAITSVWLAVHEAEAWAMMNQEALCLRALETAEKYSNKLLPDDDPYWTGFDHSLLFGFKGICNLKLSRPEAAHQALQEALALSSSSSSRQTAIFFTDLAATFVQQEEIEAACSMGQKALHLAASTKSTRVLQRLLNVRNELERWNREPSVKHLDEQLFAIQHHFL